MQRRKQVQRAGLYRDDGKRYKTMSLKTTATNFLPTTISSSDNDLKKRSGMIFKFPLVQHSELRLTDEKHSPVLSMDAVSAYYAPSKQKILSNVTLSVSLGSRIGIVGANGTGK